MSASAVLEDRQLAAKELIEYTNLLIAFMKPIPVGFPRLMGIAAARVAYTPQLAERRRSLNILNNGIRYIRVMLEQWSSQPDFDAAAVKDCLEIIQAQISQIRSPRSIS